MTKPKPTDPADESPELNEPIVSAEEEDWEDTDNPPQKWGRILGLSAGGVMILGILGGIGYGWYWVNTKLAPLVAQSLTKTLNRPIELGALQQVSLNSLRFGPSGLPPVVTDGDTPRSLLGDRATVEAVEVRFNPFDVIDNEINLDITLINPQVYLEQDENQQWLQLEITQEQPNPDQFQIKVARAGIENGTVVLVPWRGDQPSGEHKVTLQPIRASADFFDEYNRISFDATVAQPQGGQLQATGEFLNREQRLNVQLRSQAIDLIPLSALIPNLPPEVSLTGGKINGNINARLNLKDINASVLKGTLSARELAGNYTLPPSPDAEKPPTPPEPSATPAFDPTKIPLNLSQGQLDLQFQDQLIVVEKGSILYADTIPLTLEGGIHLQQGIEILASLAPVNLETLPQTLKTELPIHLTGELQAKAKIQGPFNRPFPQGDIQVIGFLETTKPTQIDQVEFQEISTKFAYAQGTVALQDLKLVPTLGGQLLGRGELQLPGMKPTVGPDSSTTGSQSVPGKPFLIFEAQGENLPLVALGQLYNLPTDQINAIALSPQIRMIGPIDDLQAIAQTPLAGGLLQAAARLTPNLLQAEFRAQNLLLASLSSQIPPALAVPFTGGGQLVAPLENFSLDQIQGAIEGELNIAGGAVQLAGRLQNNQIAGLLQAREVQLGQLRSELEQRIPPDQFRLPFAETAPFTGVVEVLAPINNLTPSTLQARVQGQLNLAGGGVTGGGRLENGQWEAALEVNQVQAYRLSPQLELAAQQQPFLQAPVTATVNLKGPATDFSPQALIAQARGSLDLAGGRVNVIAQALSGQWQASLQADQIQMGELSPQLPSGLSAAFSGVANVQGGLDDFSVNSIVAQAQGFVKVGEGLVNLEAVAQQGQWQARAGAEQVELGKLGLELPPQFQALTSAGRMVAQGRLDNFDPALIQAKAEVLLSLMSDGVRTVPVLEQGPLRSAFVWNGRSLDILEASAPGLKVSGQIFPNFENLLASRLNLNGQVEDLNLATLPVGGAEFVQIEGRIDFAGRMVGTALAPNVEGRMRLRNVVVNEVVFNPVIEGPVEFSSDRGATIALKGESDEISVVLGQGLLPESFTFKVGEAIATGQQLPSETGSASTEFKVDIAQFPLDLVNMIPQVNHLGRVGGKLSGNFHLSIPPTFDLTAVIAQGEIQVQQPTLGTVEGEVLTAKLDYAGGQGRLTNTQLTIGKSKYELDGAVNLTNLDDPQFNAEVKIAQGSAQDVLQALQIFDLADIAQGFSPPTGKALDLGTPVVGDSQWTLENQMRRLSEILRLQALRQQERDRYPIPALAQLQGAFDGSIKMSGSLKQGLSAQIDLLGENWVWGDYRFNPIIVKGTFQEGVLTLLPLRIDSNEGLITFSGKVGGDQQSGQLKVENVPVGLIEQFVPNLPVDLTGTVNATATLLGGSLENPQVIGNLSLSQGSLNEADIQEATGNFSLADGRLRFGGKLLVGGDSPITLTGNIPSPLPFGSVSPISQDIQLDLNLENEGLAILNVLTRQQVNWVAGTGNVKIQVSGTLDNPIAVGEAAIANATLTSEALSQPLNNVTGMVKFDRDKVTIQNLTGDFSKGKIQVGGLIPLANPNLALSAEEQQNPLTIALEQIDLNFQDIYSGGVNGEIQIAGAALAPVIKGKVVLTQGKIFPAEATKLQKTDGPERVSASNPLIPIFDRFQVDLTDGIAIIQPGFLDIRGQGTLSINGPVDDIRADGSIDINRGFINIISTQFRVDREHNNKARFIPSQGLDPDLDLVLEASISEVQGTRQAQELLWGQTEIDDTPPLDNNDTEIIRIQASVTGPASQLENNVELTSVPIRSRSEIIALIGGGFLNTIGGGGNTTLALANIAGSAILSNLQTSLGNALGLTELRLYPIEDRSRRGAIGLAGEATLDVTRKFSASVGKTLTSSDPARLRLRYRLSDNLVLRGATDLGGEQAGRRSTDSRIQFEYRRRF